MNTSIVGLNPLIRIDISPIDGYGLFSNVPIQKNTKITYYHGIKMSHKEFKEKYGNDITHCHRTNFSWIPIIVAKEKRNAITYCNESLHPNCIIKKYWLIANEDIPANTELTLLYAKSYPRNYSLSDSSTTDSSSFSIS